MQLGNEPIFAWIVLHIAVNVGRISVILKIILEQTFVLSVSCRRSNRAHLVGNFSSFFVLYFIYWFINRPIYCNCKGVLGGLKICVGAFEFTSIAHGVFQTLGTHVLVGAGG
jgi:hypothetical protein